MDLDWFRLSWVSLLVAVVWSGWREVSKAGRARAHDQSYEFSRAGFLKRLAGAWVFIFVVMALASYFGLIKV